MQRSPSELNLSRHDLDGKSKRELITVVMRLQSQAQSMYHSLTYKMGELDRIRDTIIGVEDDQRRFYMLKPGCLRCFESETIRNLRGEIPLYESVTVKSIRDDRKEDEGRFCFAVLSRDQRLRFAARSDAERREWMGALRKAAKAGGLQPTEAAVTSRGRSLSPAPSVRQRAKSPLSSRRAGNDSIGGGVTGVDHAASDRGGGGGGAGALPRASDVVDGNNNGKPSNVVQDTRDTSASKPMHKISRASLLSSDSTAPQSYRGLFNLLAIVAVVSNVRLIVRVRMPACFLVCLLTCLPACLPASQQAWTDGGIAGASIDAGNRWGHASFHALTWRAPPTAILSCLVNRTHANAHTRAHARMHAWFVCWLVGWFRDRSRISSSTAFWSVRRGDTPRSRRKTG